MDRDRSETAESLRKLAHFEILEILGKGGNGTVYRARNEKTDQVVALKTLNREGEVTLGRFKREFFSLKKMDHPQIVKVFQGFFDHAPPFFSMEWLKGKPLSRVISDLKKNPLAFSIQDRETFAIEVGKQICDVLSYIHSFDEIHRDLKPDNLFICPRNGRLLSDFSVKLLDFGLLKQLKNRKEQMETQQGVVVGTIQYLSPEQARGQTLDLRSDLYSLGVILYQVLGLSLPHQAKDLVANLFQIVYEEPPHLQQLVPELNPRLVYLVHQLLAKEAGDRLPSAQAVHRSLCQLTQKLNFTDLSIEDFQLQSQFEGFGDPLLPPKSIGRQRELAQLQGLFGENEQELPGIAWILGERGLGKSFLIQDWLSQSAIAKRYVMRVSFSAQSGPAQDPIGTLIDSLIREMKPSKVKNVFRDVYPFLVGTSRYLANFFDTRSVGKFHHLSSGRKMQLLAVNFIRLIERLAAEVPCIMILENCQHAQDSFFGWMTLFLEQLNTNRFCAVFTAIDPQHKPALANFYQRLTQGFSPQIIQLRPFDALTTERVLQSMIPVTKELPFDGSVIQFIEQHAEGNPQFSIELFTRLYEEQGLVITEGKLALSHERSIELPDSINQALMLKLSKLPKDATVFCEIASLFGQELETQWLSKVLGWDEERFLSTMVELEKIGIFREEEEPVAKLLFRSLEFRDLVFSQIAFEKKKKLHGLCATRLESFHHIYNDYQNQIHDDLGQPVTAERSILYFEQMAQHFSRSQNFVHATKYAYFAGNVALDLKDTERALTLYQQCLKYMSESDNRYTLNLVNIKLAEVHLKNLQYAQAIEHFQKAQQAKTISRIEKQRVLKGLAEAYRKMGMFGPAQETLDALKLHCHGSSARVNAVIHLEEGWLNWERDADAQTLCQALAQRPGTEEELSRDDELILFAKLMSNDFKSVLLHLKSRRKGSEDQGDLAGNLVLSFLNYVSGQFNRAHGFLNVSASVSEPVDLSGKLMIWHSLLGFVVKTVRQPDHDHRDDLHLAERYMSRLGFEQLKSHALAAELEIALLTQQSDNAFLLCENARKQGMMEEHGLMGMVLKSMGLNAFWRLGKTPPRAWLELFRAHTPTAKHPVWWRFHHALARSAQARLPLSGTASLALNELKELANQLKKLNFRYYHWIILGELCAIYRHLGNTTPLEALEAEMKLLQEKLVF